MTELKHLKEIADSLKGIYRELKKHNELMQRHNTILASGFVNICDTVDEEIKNEIIGGMETGKPYEV